MSDSKKDKLKICVITSWFPNLNRPGIAPFVYKFVQDLGKFGSDVSVIVPMSQGEAKITRTEFFTIYRIKKSKSFFQIYNLVKNMKPDIIHIHAPNFFSANAIPVAKLMNIPIMATVHRAEIDSTNYLISIFRKYVLSKFSKIIAVSQFAKSLAIKAGVHENNIDVIYNSCDDMLFMPRDKSTSREKINLSPDKKVILFVGNLVKVKGVYTLVESCKVLHSMIQDFLVLIIGNGEERERLQSLVNSYGLTENIKFLGWQSQAQLPVYYNSANVFVLPSITEGHSVALLEAMASGLPIIVSKTGGNIESIEDGVNGFFFEVGNAQVLAEKIARLITDVKLCEKISSHNNEIYLKKFSTRIQMETYLKLYHSLLKNN